MKMIRRVLISLLVMIIISISPIIFASFMSSAVGWTMVVLPFLFATFLIVAIVLMLRIYSSK